jgi:hypothetical protein
MKTFKTISTVLIVLALGSFSLSMLADPASLDREVHMKDNYKKVIHYVKSGAHDKSKNHPEFYSNNEDNSLGHCGTGITPEAWKFLGFTVASLKINTTKSPVWSNYIVSKLIMPPSHGLTKTRLRLPLMPLNQSSLVAVTLTLSQTSTIWISRLWRLRESIQSSTISRNSAMSTM